MIICLTGMHRSGTSLMSSYFVRCGFDMGDRLVGAMPGNERGHFEDLEFVNLHDHILASNKCHMYTPGKKLLVSDTQKKHASALIKSKMNPLSGWKDPRSTLFLNFWAELDPDIFFVLLYRDPYSVIDSLRRRGTDRRIKIFPWIPAKSWLRYNTELLDFHESNKDRSVIVNIGGFNKSHEKSRKILSKAMNISLDAPYTDVYYKLEIAELPGSGNILSSAVDRIFRPRMDTLYQAMEQVALINSNGAN